MAGTKIGGLKAAAANKALYGEDYYKRIGIMGKKTGKGGFWYMKYVLNDSEFARNAGRKGGKISKRSKTI